MDSSTMDILTLMLVTFTLMQMTASQDCNFGPSCRFTCNCQPGGDTCDVNTGNCPGGCEVGSPSDYDWTGHGCLTGNVAYDKNATQNGIYGGWTAAGAVDGSTDTRQGCSHPLADLPPSGQCPSNDQCQNAWWQVDLGRLHRVTRVIIVNTDRAGGENIRMNHIIIKVGNSTHLIDGAYQCNIFDDTMDSGETRSLDCTAPLIGRYVTLFKYSKTDIQNDLIGSFTVCEIIVIGNIYNDCGQCSDPDVCTDQYGCVSGCDGWDSDTLCNTECPDGTFGVNCQSECGQCSGTDPCHKQSGRCPNGCQQWWADDMCLMPIAPVDFPSGAVLSVTDTGRDHLTISWSAITSIPQNNAAYYGYRIQYRIQSASSWTLVTDVPHPTDRPVITRDIRSLRYYTDYDLRVTVYRTQGGSKGFGNYISTTGRTSCIAPDNAEILELSNVDPKNVTGLERIYIKWRLPSMTGCSRLSSCTIHVTAGSTEYQEDCPISSGEGSATLSPPDPGTYTVYIRIVNNEHLSSRSQSRDIILNNVTAVRTADPLLAVYILAPLLVIIAAVGAIMVVRKRSGRPLPAIKLPKIRRTTQSIAQLHDSPDDPGPKPQPKSKPKPRLPVKTRPPVPEPSNHVYINHLIISNVLSKAELEHYFSDLVKRNKLKAAYDAIPKHTEASCDIGRKKAHVLKNRYKNILPYDDTRVTLPLVDDKDNTDYINANIVTGYHGMDKDYIAAQGPKIETVDDFWRMVVDRNVRQIVMLTLCKELNTKLCEPYWPGDGSSTKYFGDIQVRIHTTAVTAHYTVRTLTVHTQNIQMQVTHYQVVSWKDKTKPDSPLPMYDLLHRVRARARESDQGTLLVHCSAGVGRTGTYIALDYLLDQLAAENQLDIDGTIHKLRHQRPLLVQTLNQYSFIYEFLIMYCKVGHSHVTTKQLADSLFISENNSERTFKSLMRLRSDAPTVGGFQGASPENRNKNRNPHMIPSDDVRPYLSLPCGGSNDYINAAFVDSFWHTRSLILTQVPLHNTIVDFWRLVYDQKVATVVLLDQLKPIDNYWPTDTGSSHSHGPLEVLLRRKSMSPKISHYDLRVSKTTRPNDGQDLRLYQLHGWYSSASVPPNAQHVLDLLDTIQIPIKTGKEIIIQCLDGVSHCGLFCAGSDVIAQSQMWTEVDVPLAVMTVRERRQDYIINKAQFEFLYQLVHAKLSVSQGATYANLPQGQHRELVYANTVSESVL